MDGDVHNQSDVSDVENEPSDVPSAHFLRPPLCVFPRSLPTTLFKSCILPYIPKQKNK